MNVPAEHSGSNHDWQGILLQINFQQSPGSDSDYWTCSQKAKNQKAKQTVMHCTTKQYNTRQEMKWNAMRWKNDQG